jgi:hypothetical protein
MISVIRTERKRLADDLTILNEEYHETASEQWLFTAEPFINDMCLMVLVALRHQVERELVFLAARANVGKTISLKEYRQNVAVQRKLKPRDGWKKLSATLNLNSFAEWTASMETLHLLANCLKHEPTQEPDKELLTHLKLPLKPIGPRIVGYLPLPESHCFREGLAASVNLRKDADYCTIADTFVDMANQFLDNVQGKTSLAQVLGEVSLSEFAC